MKIHSKEQSYRVDLEAEENIKILVNDVEVFNMTVPVGKISGVSFKYSENDTS